MIFFGTARWESHADEHGAHGDTQAPRVARRSCSSRSSCSASLAIFGGLMQLPHLGIIPDEWSTISSTGSSRWSGFGEADITSTWADDHLVLLLIARHRVLVRRHRARLADLPEAADQGGRAEAPRRGLVLRHGDHLASWAVPGRKGFEAIAWFDAHGHRRRRQRTSAASSAEVATERPQGQTGYVCAATPRSSASAWCCCSPGSSSSGGSSDARPETTLALGFPILTAIDRSCRSSARSLVALSPQPSPRVRQAAGRCSSPRGHRRRSRCGCSPRSRPATPASSSSVDAHVDHRRGASRWHLGVDGISLFLVVLTGVLFPLAIVGVDPHHDEQAVLRVAAAAQAGVHRACSSASTCSCSSSSSRSCSCRCTSSSAAGATTTASTRPRSSSCSRCSARRSCSSASSPRSFLARANGVGAHHLRPRRDRRAAPNFAAVDRRAGCSSPSPSRSPSRCRCSRCTRGCPTPTPRRRRPAR